jgi:hypothetical protein
MRSSRAVGASLDGAVIVGVSGYLFCSDLGDVTPEIELALDDIARELNSFRSTMQNGAEMTSAGWKCSTR